MRQGWQNVMTALMMFLSQSHYMWFQKAARICRSCDLMRLIAWRNKSHATYSQNPWLYYGATIVYTISLTPPCPPRLLTQSFRCWARARARARMRAASRSRGHTQLYNSIFEKRCTHYSAAFAKKKGILQHLRGVAYSAYSATPPLRINRVGWILRAIQKTSMVTNISLAT